MSKSIFAYLTVVASIAVTALAQNCPNGICPIKAPRAETPHPAVVRIINEQNGQRILGSGTLVKRQNDRGLIVSCGHLFREYRGNVTVAFPNGETFAARILDVDLNADLSALLIAMPSAPAVRVAFEPPHVGDPLVSAGYGPHGQYATNHGRALGYVSLEGGPREVLELTGSARQGDSGGPIFNATGELAGVLFGTDGRRVDGTFCGRVKAFLAGCGIGDSQNDAVAESPQPKREEAPPQIAEQVPEAPAPREDQNAEALAKVQAQFANLHERIAKLEVARANVPVSRPGARVPEGAAPAGGGLVAKLEALLDTKLTALLVSFGLPGGAAAVIAWFLLHRGRKHVKQIVDRVVIHDQSPPLPQVIERNREFVEVQIPTNRQTAIEWAMDEYVKRNPGARPTVETIEAYAKQYQAGKGVEVRG